MTLIRATKHVRAFFDGHLTHVTTRMGGITGAADKLLSDFSRSFPDMEVSSMDEMENVEKRSVAELPLLTHLPLEKKASLLAFQGSLAFRAALLAASRFPHTYSCISIGVNPALVTTTSMAI